MPEVSQGDTTPLSFDSPTLSWSEPTPSPEAESPTADTPSEGAPAASSPEAATVPPVDSANEGAKPRDIPGPIPFDRHTAVLAGERTKYSELEAKWQRVAWANKLVEDGASPEQVHRALEIHGSLRNDPVAFIKQLLSEAAGDARLAQQVRAIAGQILGTGRNVARPNSQPDGDDPEPQPDFRDENGTPFMSYPQQKKWGEWQSRQLKSSIEKENAPIREWFASQQEREQAAESRRAFNQEVETLVQSGKARLEELKQLGSSYYTDDFMKKMSEYSKSKNHNVSVDEAWNYVYHTHVLPTLSQTSEARTIAQLRTQAASSSVSPRAASASVPANPKGFFDPALKW